MKVIRKINNNAAVCLDGNNNEIVVIGRGVGFPAIPYDLTDLSKIERTYYMIDPNYVNMLNYIPEDIFRVSTYLVDEYRQKNKIDISSNIIFTLADHIDFTIKRLKQNMTMSYPMSNDIQFLYEEEYEFGLYAIKYINKTLNVRLPKKEAGNIALHIINAQASLINQTIIDEENVLNEVTNIIGKHFNIFIDK
ncbi:MAG: PRD domain-containing protein, partial [Holdemanella sp.]|nr:PRD domain-containing protein [Holdemanella sp.]